MDSFDWLLFLALLSASLLTPESSGGLAASLLLPLNNNSFQSTANFSTFTLFLLAFCLSFQSTFETLIFRSSWILERPRLLSNRFTALASCPLVYIPKEEKIKPLLTLENIVIKQQQQPAI